MTSLDEIRGALESCYAQFEAVCADLSTADWQARSLCPEWTVQEVVQHVTSIEAVMAGWLPEDDATPPPFENAAEFLAGSDDPAVLVDKVHAVYDRRRGDLRALTVEDLQRPSWMPTGRGTYGRFLEIRVFDFWVHERDITTPLGRKTDDSGPSAEIALAEVEKSIGYIVGKKVGLPDGKSLAIRLTGPIRARDRRAGRRPRSAGRPPRAPGCDADDGLHDLHPARLRPYRPAGPDRLRCGQLER